MKLIIILIVVGMKKAYNNIVLYNDLRKSVDNFYDKITIIYDIQTS